MNGPHIAPVSPSHPHYELSYDLQYAHCTQPDPLNPRDGHYEARSVRVIMLRNPPDQLDPDYTFSVAICETGEILSCEDDKQSANHAACYLLTQRTEKAARLPFVTA